MQRLSLLPCVLLFAACASEQPPEEMAPAAPAGLMASDVAGQWSFVSVLESGDTVPSTMIASEDLSGWKLVLEGRDTIPTTAMIAGDSVVTTAGPFESVLRPGVMVTSTIVTRLVNGQLIGTLTARYEGQGADSVARGSVTGTRHH